METFRYEHTLKLTESMFVSLRSLFSRKTRPARLILFLLFGVACLFCSYTAVLGLFALLVAAAAMLAPSLFPGTAVREFRQTSYLHQPLTFVVSDQGLQIRCEDLDLQCTWPNLRVWQLRDGWLRLAPHGMQELFFKVDLLTEAGVYDQVMTLAREHGVEFNSKEAKKGVARPGRSN